MAGGKRGYLYTPVCSPPPKTSKTRADISPCFPIAAATPHGSAGPIHILPTPTHSVQAGEHPRQAPSPCMPSPVPSSTQPHHRMYLDTSLSTRRSSTRACTRALSTVMVLPSGWSDAAKEISYGGRCCWRSGVRESRENKNNKEREGIRAHQ